VGEVRELARNRSQSINEGAVARIRFYRFSWRSYCQLSTCSLAARSLDLRLRLQASKYSRTYLSLIRSGGEFRILWQPAIASGLDRLRLLGVTGDSPINLELILFSIFDPWIRETAFHMVLQKFCIVFFTALLARHSNSDWVERGPWPQVSFILFYRSSSSDTCSIGRDCPFLLWAVVRGSSPTEMANLGHLSWCAHIDDGSALRKGSRSLSYSWRCGFAPGRALLTPSGPLVHFSHFRADDDVA